MHNKKLLMSLGMAILASKAAKSISNVSFEDVLGKVGLARRQSHALENLGLIALGAALGAGVAILFAPASGRETRQRLGEEATKLTTAATEAIRERKDEALRAITQAANGTMAEHHA
jgi:hypothetical protein